MSSNRSSESEIFTDSQFPNKKLGDLECSEDFLPRQQLIAIVPENQKSSRIIAAFK